MLATTWTTRHEWSRPERSVASGRYLDAVGVIGIWIVSLRRGAFEHGLCTYQLGENVPIVHLAAEFGWRS